MLLASRFVLMVVLGGLFIFLFTVGFANMSIVMKIILVVVGAVLGFFLPQLLVQAKIDRRQQDIVKALPDALDLLTVCVEAGLGFDAAMGKVAEKWETDLSLEFARVNREIQLGKARREALRSMADRLGVADLTSFIAAVIQTEQLGVSLSKVLRIQVCPDAYAPPSTCGTGSPQSTVEDAHPNDAPDLPDADHRSCYTSNFHDLQQRCSGRFLIKRFEYNLLNCIPSGCSFPLFPALQSDPISGSIKRKCTGNELFE